MCEEGMLLKIRCFYGLENVGHTSLQRVVWCEGIWVFITLLL